MSTADPTAQLFVTLRTLEQVWRSQPPQTIVGYGQDSDRCPVQQYIQSGLPVGYTAAVLFSMEGGYVVEVSHPARPLPDTMRVQLSTGVHDLLELLDSLPDGEPITAQTALGQLAVLRAAYETDYNDEDEWPI